MGPILFGSDLKNCTMDLYQYYTTHSSPISLHFLSFRHLLKLWLKKVNRYFLLFLRLYGISEIVFHSLFISAYKYIFILHNEGVRSIGQERIKKMLFWVNMSLPVFFAFSYIIRPNNQAFNTVHSCGLLEDSDMVDVAINETVGAWKSVYIQDVKCIHLIDT